MEFHNELFHKIDHLLKSSKTTNIFVTKEAGRDLSNNIIKFLIDIGAKHIVIAESASFMDYISEALGADDGDTVVFDGVQNIKEEFLDDFQKIIEKRKLSGVIGEGDAATPFEIPIPSLKIAMIDHGSEGFNAGPFRMRLASHLVITNDEIVIQSQSEEMLSDEDVETSEGASLPLAITEALEAVRDEIDSIEDKLYERGMLVAATGDPDPEVRITFEEWGAGGERGCYWVISITAEEPDEIDEDEFEDISDYVGLKIDEMSQHWSDEVSDAFSDCFGYVVLLNGSQVY